MKAKEYDDTGINRLRAAILFQAYKDLVEIKTKKRTGNAYSIEKFFRSEWGHELLPVGLNAETIIKEAERKEKAMYKEFEEEYMNHNTASKIVFDLPKARVDEAIARMGNIKAMKLYLNGKIRKYNRTLKNKEKEAENKKRAEVYKEVLDKLKELGEE